MIIDIETGASEHAVDEGCVIEGTVGDCLGDTGSAALS